MLNSKQIVLIVALLFGTLVPLYGQEIKVVDQENGDPIAEVAIFNKAKDQSVITNKEGIADISGFEADDTLIFQHSAYYRRQISVDNARQKDKVVLTEKVMNLNEVVISANKWAQNIADVPNKIQPITEEEIEFDNPQTSADLLDASNEVFVQKSQLGGGSPMIRGFATKSVLLTVDGVRMNNAIFRGGNLQNVINLDPHAVERTEVIFGPGSVIYGSDALGGVMSFHTKDPKLSGNEDVRVDGNVMTRYATANDENTGHIDLNIGT